MILVIIPDLIIIAISMKILFQRQVIEIIEIQ